MSEAHQTNKGAGEGPSHAGFGVKKKEMAEDDFTFDEPCLKMQKTTGTCQRQPTALPPNEAQALRKELNMNWDLIEVC